MFVKCVTNLEKYREGYGRLPIDGISLGVFYQVYSISIETKGTEYLLYNKDSGRPCWFQSWLFETIHSGIPDHWHIIETDKYSHFLEVYNRGVLAFIGPEQIKEKFYLNDLFEYEPEALAFFYQDKLKTDTWWARETFLNCCRVCGYRLDFFPWGIYNDTPTLELCPCCGVQFGVMDETPLLTKTQRQDWLKQGCQWFDPTKKTLNLDFNAQMMQIPEKFR